MPAAKTTLLAILLLLPATECWKQAQAQEKPVDKAVESDELDPAAAELANALFGTPPAGEFPNVAVDPQANDEELKNFEQQFQPLVNAELYLIRKTCQPNAVQYAALKTARDTTLKSAARQFVAAQRKINQGGFRIVNGRPQQQFPDPRQIIHQEMLKTVQKICLPEKTNAYLAEIKAKSEQRKNATILVMVAKADRELLLTQDQREKLKDALQKHWQEEWQQNLEYYIHSDEYIPRPTNDAIMSLLTPSQKAAWQARANQQQHFVWGWGGLGFGGMSIDADHLKD